MTGSDSQSPEEGVGRVLLEFRVTGPQPCSIESFLPDNDHPSPTIISQISNTSRTVNIKLNKRPGSNKKLYPPSLPEQIFALAIQQILQIQKRSSEKQNLSANRKDKHKIINGKRSEQGEQVRLGTIVGMIRRNTSKKRPREQSKQWLDNEILFPSTPRSKKLRVVASTIHSMIKFPTANGIATVTTKKETLHEGRRMEEVQGSALKPPEKVVIHDDYSDQTVTDGGNLSAECRFRLIEILRKHADAFAWTLADMTGIPRFIVEYELKTYPDIELRVQRKQGIASDKRKVVKVEVAEWLKAEIVRKSKIGWKIESLMRFKYKCFLDAYKGYHQIQMTKKDEEKTTFHTDEGVFCYTKMPFGLKNTGATYQRLVDTIFEGQMGINLEAYVDDMVIKSKTEPEMIKDEGKFLGYIVTSEGIRANPEKEKAVINMPSPSNLKQMQRLTGKLAALNRFLSKEAEKAPPFLNTLKECTNKKDFHWTTEAEEAFQEMKKLIVELPTLMAPKKEE
nr:hypothetical protein [Tanacetum cinerariifolium]